MSAACETGSVRKACPKCGAVPVTIPDQLHAEITSPGQTCGLAVLNRDAAHMIWHGIADLKSGVCEVRFYVDRQGFACSVLAIESEEVGTDHAPLLSREPFRIAFAPRVGNVELRVDVRGVA